MVLEISKNTAQRQREWQSKLKVEWERMDREDNCWGSTEVPNTKPLSTRLMAKGSLGGRSGLNLHGSVSFAVGPAKP